MPTNFTIGTTANVLPAAPSNTRYGFVQNLSTTPLFISFDGSATTTHFNIVLAGCATAGDGTGGFVSFDDYLGIVTGASSTLSYIAWWI